ncbi:hypothetical protein [Kitasatospora sp. LaBMicrA B282]|uniref:hypothetical protein n=1 Tax=Kitasatospora sp. LaBMicrA B282 TaxID=3420949 RepID=UPI003D0EA4D1
MTQDGHGGIGGAAVAAPAERISASLDSLAEGLLGPGVARHAPAALFSAAAAPGELGLFDTWLTRTGPGRLARAGRGTVVSCTLPAAPGGAAGTVERLHAHYGPQPVRGVPVAESARPGAFQLPVSAEPSAARLRPAFAAPLAELAAGRRLLLPAELPTGSGVEVRFTVPPAFHALTVRGDDAAAAEQLGEVAEELFAAGSAAERRDWAVLTAALLDESTAAGVRFAAVAAVELDGRPSNATLVAALHQDRTPIAELAAELATSRPHAEVWTVILPSGPAVVLVQGRTGAVPGALAADGNRRWVVSSVVQAFLSLPDGATLLSLQLGTAHGEDWELYATVFAELLRSVEFGWDGVPAPADAPRPVTVTPVAVAPIPTPTAPPVPVPAPATPPAGTPLPPVPPMPPAPPAVPPAVPPAAPPAPPTTLETPAPQDAPKGTKVDIPPPDFDPFAPQEPVTPATPAAPAAPATPQEALAPTPAPQPLDPFGTVMNNQPQDPFGTVTRTPATTIPATTTAPTPPAPSVTAPPTEPAAATDAPPKKGTKVNIPPPDFDPFAPQEPVTPATQDAPKGTKVDIPPPDFDPFAPQEPVTPATQATTATPADPFAKPDPFAL